MSIHNAALRLFHSRQTCIYCKYYIYSKQFKYLKTLCVKFQGPQFFKVSANLVVIH